MPPCFHFLFQRAILRPCFQQNVLYLPYHGNHGLYIIFRYILHFLAEQALEAGHIHIIVMLPQIREGQRKDPAASATSLTRTVPPF